MLRFGKLGKSSHSQYYRHYKSQKLKSKYRPSQVKVKQKSQLFRWALLFPKLDSKSIFEKLIGRGLLKAIKQVLLLIIQVHSLAQSS